jgi:hypothetical protein
VLPLAMLGGCTQTEPPASVEPQLDRSLARDFLQAKTGVIKGRVRWYGPHPVAKPFKVQGPAGAAEFEPELPNPHLPAIDGRTNGVGQALVFLRQVEPRLSRPWSHAPVRIEHAQRQIVVHQGAAKGNLGIVRQGDTVEICNRDADLHILRGRGTAFFSLPFPEADQPSVRRLEKPGIVELASGAGYFWMSGHLFVSAHPYVALTDEQGNFKLDEVPAGKHELVTWLPNWRIGRFQRHTESTLVIGVEYRPAVEHELKVEVTAGKTTEASFEWTSKDFVRLN